MFFTHTTATTNTCSGVWCKTWINFSLTPKYILKMLYFFDKTCLLQHIWNKMLKVYEGNQSNPTFRKTITPVSHLSMTQLNMYERYFYAVLQWYGESQYRQYDLGDVINWKQFPRYWPFVWWIHRSPVNSPHKGQWREALICTWIKGWVNNREAVGLRRRRAHYDVTVMVNPSAARSWWAEVPFRRLKRIWHPTQRQTAPCSYV